MNNKINKNSELNVFILGDVTKCWKKQADASKLSTHMTEEIENEEQPMFLTCNITQESSKYIWFLDSACSNHMTGNKELLSSLDTSIQSEVKLGNDCK